MITISVPLFIFSAKKDVWHLTQSPVIPSADPKLDFNEINKANPTARLV
jgi:hypothetical protein